MPVTRKPSAAKSRRPSRKPACKKDITIKDLANRETAKKLTSICKVAELTLASKDLSSVDKKRLQEIVRLSKEASAQQPCLVSARKRT